MDIPKYKITSLKIKTKIFNNKNPYHRYVQYLVPDISPGKGLKEMKYYFNNPNTNNPDLFRLGFNHIDIHEKEELENLVKEGKLIKLPKAVRLLELKSLFLNADNEIIMALTHNPEKGQKLIHKL